MVKKGPKHPYVINEQPLMYLAFWGPTAPHACPSFGCKYLFETDILLYMNLYRANKIVWERHFTLYEFT